MYKRQAAWTEFHGVEYPEDSFALVQDAQNILSTKDIERIASGAERLKNLKLIVIDTLSANFNGNENEDIAKGLKNLGLLRNTTGATILLTHHYGKDRERGPRGSSAFGGNLQTVYSMDGDLVGGVTVHCEKQKDLPIDYGFLLKTRPQGKSLVFATCKDIRELRKEAAEEAKVNALEEKFLKYLEPLRFGPKTKRELMSETNMGERSVAYALSEIAPLGWVRDDGADNGKLKTWSLTEKGNMWLLNRLSRRIIKKA